MVSNFPKSYKYTLGQNIIDHSWEVIDGVIEANSLSNKLKEPVIRSASASFDKLKLRLRMAHELKLINHKKFSFLIGREEEIGKMLSGWLKWAKNSKSF